MAGCSALTRFQFPLPKLSSSSSPSYSIRTHFPSNPFGKNFHFRCLQQDSSPFPQEDPCFRSREPKPKHSWPKQNTSDTSSNQVDEAVETAGNEEKSASSIDSKPDDRVVAYNVNPIPNEEGGTTGVNVSVVWSDGEYVLKIKRSDISISTDNEDAVETLQNAGILFLQAQIVREMGEKLLAQYRASLRSIL